MDFGRLNRNALLFSFTIRYKNKNKRNHLHVINQVMTNQDAVDIARRTRDPQKAAKQLTAEALKRDSKDDISCVVVKFR